MLKHYYLLSFVILLISCNSGIDKSMLDMQQDENNLLPADSTINNSNPPTQQILNYLALGDSYTIGESVEYDERYPVQLVSLLKEININFNEPRIIAKTGWTTDELFNELEKSTISSNYDFVTLLIGVNNQYRGRSVDEFIVQFNSLLDKAISYANNDSSKVLVISIPDWGVTPFAKNRDRIKISNEIDAFNEAKRNETEKRGIQFVTITEISRLAATNKNYIAKDSLHFSGEMYTLWAKEIISNRFN